MRNKIFLWLLFVFSYLMLIPFIIYSATAMVNEEVSDSLAGMVIILCSLLALITFIVCVLNILTAVFGYRKELPSPYKLTMIVKLCMIPFYIVNFTLWGLFIIVCLMYPLLWGMALLLLAMSLISTYIIMISSGIYNVVYALKDFKRYRSPVYLLYLIGHFVFCLDVIAAVALYMRGKTEKQNVAC